jgi:hypothetical protein
MPSFTLWSKKRLVGRARIMYFPPFPGQRCGDFVPTELGEQLMSVMLGAHSAITTFYDFAALASEEARANGVKFDEEWPDSVRNSTEYADMISSRHELDSLDLELRDSSNNVVPTDWIQIKDVEQMTREARQIMNLEAATLGLDIDDLDLEELGFDESDLADSDLDESDFDDPEPWEQQPPRYQIMFLQDGARRLQSKAAARRRKKERRNRGQG